MRWPPVPFRRSLAHSRSPPFHPDVMRPPPPRGVPNTFVRHSIVDAASPGTHTQHITFSPCTYMHSAIFTFINALWVLLLLSGVSVATAQNMCHCAASRPCFVFRHPTGHIRNIFLQPFADYVWWCILICGILTIIASAHISTVEQQIDGRPSTAGEPPHCDVFRI